MLGSLVRHSFLAILLAVAIEELGIPMPIPTDVMIVFAGTTAHGSAARLALDAFSLTLASAAGGSCLYFIVRRGGRPLVERFGRYVRLGPERLARAESLIERGGVWSIAVGRAIPGLRYATVIVCGLLKVPFPRYLTGHVLGSTVYITVFLSLGAVFGPEILRLVHLPAHALRLLWLLPLALGLPVLVAYWGQRVRSQVLRGRPQGGTLSVGAVLLSGFFGTVAFAATLSTSAAVAEMLGASHPLNVVYDLLGWLLLGEELGRKVTAVVLYAVLLMLLLGLAVAYYELALPYLKLHRVSPLRRIFGLASLALILLGCVFLISLFAQRDGSFDDVWWRAGGPTIAIGICVGVVAYATTVVYGRVLAIAALATTIRGS